MPEVKFIESKAKQLLLMDFAGITNADTFSGLVDQSITLVESTNGRHSVLALLDLSKTRLNGDVFASLKRLSQNNGPHIKAITFVGLGHFSGTMLRMLFRLARKKNHRVMRKRTQALDWLVQQ